MGMCKAGNNTVPRFASASFFPLLRTQIVVEGKYLLSSDAQVKALVKAELERPTSPQYY